MFINCGSSGKHSKLILKLLFICTFYGLLFSPSIKASEDKNLTLDECIKMGVSQNLQILSDQLAPKEKKLEIEVARKIFIPQARAGLSGMRKGRTGIDYSYSLEKKTVNGTNFGLDLSGEAFSKADKDHTKFAFFSLNRPLLQNFGRQITGYNIDSRSIEYETSLELFKFELNQFIQQLSGLYFELYFARENLRIQEQALERARKQYDDTKNDIDNGVLPEQEIFLVEENVVNFEIKRESALRDIAYYELSIKRLMNIDEPENTSFIASDSFTACLSENINLEDSQKITIENNPGYQIKNLALKKSRIDMDFYQNKLLPVLDLQANYGVTRRDSSFKKDEYSIGLVYEVPLSRKADRAMVEKSKIATKRNELTMNDVEFNLEYDLRKLFLDIEYQRKVLKAKGHATELASKKLENESEKYKNGISTLADVVRFQRELEDSTIEEIRTLVLLNKFRIQKLLLEGTLYKSFGIEIDQ